MSRRTQASVTIAVGAVVAAFGLYGVLAIACCSGWPRLAPWLFVGYGAGILGLGLWSLPARLDRPGRLRRNPLGLTLASVVVAFALLAHFVHGIRREREFAMRWEEAPSGGAVILVYESHPDRFLAVDDPHLATYLRGLPDRRVETTQELTWVFGSLRQLRLVRVGERRSPLGFAVTSGVRGSGGSSEPWD